MKSNVEQGSKDVSAVASQRFPEISADFESLKQKLASWPFKEIDRGVGSFDRRTQIEGCAKLIEAYQGIAEDKEWKAFAKSHAKKSPMGRILKGALKNAIRISSESGDYLLTVDFISKRAIELLEDNWTASGKMPSSLFFELKNLHHEHMIPGEEVCKQIVAGEKALKFESICDILDAAGCRAIVYSDRGTEGCQRDRLDKPNSLKIGVPNSIHLSNGQILARENVEPKLLGLLRYHHAGIIDDLVPVSERGRQLLDEYRKVVTQALAGTLAAN